MLSANIDWAREIRTAKCERCDTGRSRITNSRLFSSCEGIIDGAFDMILETNIRYQEKKRECVVFLYFTSIKLSSPILRRVPTS